MIIGYPPFYADTPNETCKKIINFKDYLVFPSEPKITNEALDLLKKLITDVDKRLGYNGAEEIKKHPFFNGIDWKNIRKIKPPFIPTLNSDYDVKYFDKFEDDNNFYCESDNNLNDKSNNNNIKSIAKLQKKKDLCFIDFTYNKYNEENTNLVNAIEILNKIKENFIVLNKEIEKDKIHQIEKRSKIIKDNDNLNNTKKSPCKNFPFVNQLNTNSNISNILRNKKLGNSANKNCSNIESNIDISKESNNVNFYINNENIKTNNIYIKRNPICSSNKKKNISNNNSNIIITVKDKINNNNLSNNKEKNLCEDKIPKLIDNTPTKIYTKTNKYIFSNIKISENSITNKNLENTNIKKLAETVLQNKTIKIISQKKLCTSASQKCKTENKENINVNIINHKNDITDNSLISKKFLNSSNNNKKTNNIKFLSNFNNSRSATSNSNKTNLDSNAPKVLVGSICNKRNVNNLIPIFSERTNISNNSTNEKLFKVSCSASNSLTKNSNKQLSNKININSKNKLPPSYIYNNFGKVNTKNIINSSKKIIIPKPLLSNSKLN